MHLGSQCGVAGRADDAGSYVRAGLACTCNLRHCDCQFAGGAGAGAGGVGPHYGRVALNRADSAVKTMTMAMTMAMMGPMSGGVLVLLVLPISTEPEQLCSDCRSPYHLRDDYFLPRRSQVKMI